MLYTKLFMQRLSWLAFHASFTILCSSTSTLGKYIVYTRLMNEFSAFTVSSFEVKLIYNLHDFIQFACA